MRFERTIGDSFILIAPRGKANAPPIVCGDVERLCRLDEESAEEVAAAVGVAGEGAYVVEESDVVVEDAEILAVEESSVEAE